METVINNTHNTGITNSTLDRIDLFPTTPPSTHTPCRHKPLSPHLVPSISILANCKHSPEPMRQCN